ncbi:11999_t:CDS:2 [Acaulospora colombiana]|uniref:11999_t:CDS:1 n=1 Tax=Acaulospora colombiana TaxID=27376 RepID=A0ACA9NQF1_9GLOM|nr:11999_t:CDS:2 [Acaulospora colombiana]
MDDARIGLTDVESQVEDSASTGPGDLDQSVDETISRLKSTLGVQQVEYHCSKVIGKGPGVKASQSEFEEEKRTKNPRQHECYGLVGKFSIVNECSRGARQGRLEKRIRRQRPITSGPESQEAEKKPNGEGAPKDDEVEWPDPTEEFVQAIDEKRLHTSANDGGGQRLGSLPSRVILHQGHVVTELCDELVPHDEERLYGFPTKTWRSCGQQDVGERYLALCEKQKRSSRVVSSTNSVCTYHDPQDPLEKKPREITPTEPWAHIEQPIMSADHWASAKIWGEFFAQAQQFHPQTLASTLGRRLSLSWCREKASRAEEWQETDRTYAYFDRWRTAVPVAGVDFGALR